MIKEGFRKVGKVKDAHGLRGELYILIFSGDISWLNQLKELCLFKPSSEAAGSWLAFQLDFARPHKQGFIARSSEILDRNGAEALKGSDFYIPENFLVASPGERIYLSEIEGFQLLDREERSLGEIVGFSSNGVQDLLVIRNSPQTESLVPLVPEFVIEIRFARQEMVMDLPPGLIEEEEES